MTTFQQFQATGRDSNDLGDALSFDTGLEMPIKGRIYADTLYIEDTTSWTDQSKVKGRWYLLINRDDWFSDDLTDLEHRLYDYFLSEGYDDPC